MRITGIFLKKPTYETFTFEIKNYVLSVFIQRDDQAAIPINEAKQQGISLGGQYSAIPLTVPDPGKEHIHVYVEVMIFLH